MATIRWRAGDNGNWTDAGDWVGGAVPTASDTAFVPSSDGEGGPTVTSPIQVGSIQNHGTIQFDNAGSCVVSGDFSNGLHVTVSGSDLTIGGELINRFDEPNRLGDGNYFSIDAYSRAAQVSVGSVDNGAGGFIDMEGGTTKQAVLDVNGSASFGTAGTVTGDVHLTGNALIEFAGTSQITTIAAGGGLGVNGSHAFVADAGLGLDSNSALTGLTTIDGGFGIGDGARLATSGPLSIGASANVDIGQEARYDGETVFAIGGGVTNRGYIHAEDLSRSSIKISMASLDNAGGELRLEGTSQNTGGLATVKIGSPASFGAQGVLEGTVVLEFKSLIEFAGRGQIKTIDANASLQLVSDDAFIADARIGLTSNTALTGLATIDGSLVLSDGAEVDAARGLAVGDQAAVTIYDGGTLSTRYSLTNNGDLNLSSGGTLEVGTALVNNHIMSFGVGALTPSLDHLDVTGRIYNNGQIVVDDMLDLGTDVRGRGSFEIGQDLTLGVGAGVARGQTFYLSKGDMLELADPSRFEGYVRGFGAGDSYLFDAYDTSTSFNFVENAANTGGVLDVTDGAMSAHVRMHGVYTNSDFQLTHVQGGAQISSTR